MTAIFSEHSDFCPIWSFKYSFLLHPLILLLFRKCNSSCLDCFYWRNVLLSLSMKLVIHKKRLFTICNNYSNCSSPSLIIFMLQAIERSLLNVSWIGITSSCLSIVPVYNQIGVTVTLWIWCVALLLSFQMHIWECGRHQTHNIY